MEKEFFCPIQSHEAGIKATKEECWNEMITETTLGLKTVGEIMTSKVVIFRKVKFHHLIVVDGAKIVGLITDRDFLKAISPYVDTMSETNRDRATLEKRAHQIMSHYPVTVQKSCQIQTAAKLMLDRRVSCLPVTMPDGIIAGVVTWKDVFKAFLESPNSTE
jgi:acetoin utilization protein AcuB